MALSLSLFCGLARRGLSGINASWSPDFPRASFLRELRDARVRPTACRGRIAGGKEGVKGFLEEIDGRFCIDGKTQDERALKLFLGEESFAHGARAVLLAS